MAESTTSPSLSQRRTPQFRSKRAEETRARLERAKSVPVSEMVQRMFGSEYVLEETSKNRGQWKMEIPGHGILAITGNAFNLNWTKGGKGRFFGVGSVNLYCDLKNLSRDDYMQAVNAINEAFFHNVAIDASAQASLRAQIEERKRRAAEDRKRQEAPVALPEPSVDSGDVAQGKKYLSGKRGLSSDLIEAAFASGAAYVTRRHPIEEFKGTPPLGIVFPGLDHKTDEKTSFAWRSLEDDGPHSKINRGPKSLCGFRLGKMVEGGRLVVVESAIEGMSYWDLKMRTAPHELKNTAIEGMSGRSDPRYLLEAAKARGVTQVVAAFNNDTAGREMNNGLLAAAKATGLHAKEELFYGEVRWSWQDIPEHGTHDDLLERTMARVGIPSIEKVDARPGWRSLQMPNVAPVRDLIEELKKQRVDETVIYFQGKNANGEQAAELKKLLDEAGAPYSRAPRNWGEQWSILQRAGVQASLASWQALPAVKEMAAKRGYFAKKTHLAEPHWVCKDWNDNLRGREQLHFRDHPLVVAEWGAPEQKRELTKADKPAPVVGRER